MDWIDRHYRVIMLLGMLIEILLIAVLVVEGMHP
jgi:hypothetical protein